MKDITINNLTTSERIIIKFEAKEGFEHMADFVKQSVIEILSVSGKVVAISDTNSDSFKQWMTIPQLIRWIDIISNVTSGYENFIGIEIQ